MTDEIIQADLQRDLGRVEGKVDAMGAQHVAMSAKLDTIVAYIEREKGAKRTWGTITAVGGTVAGALGGALLSWFTGGAKTP